MRFLTVYIFTQDNDPKLTALNARLWLLYITSKVLKTLSPYQSSGIKIIMYLWEEIDVRKRCNKQKGYK